jgi:hypothetical protein
VPLGSLQERFALLYGGFSTATRSAVKQIRDDSQFVSSTFHFLHGLPESAISKRFPRRNSIVLLPFCTQDDKTRALPSEI